jgi:hypothetical protein
LIFVVKEDTNQETTKSLICSKERFERHEHSFVQKRDFKALQLRGLFPRAEAERTTCKDDDDDDEIMMIMIAIIMIKL